MEEYKQTSIRMKKKIWDVLEAIVAHSNQELKSYDLPGKITITETIEKLILDRAHMLGI